MDRLGGFRLRAAYVHSPNGYNVRRRLASFDADTGLESISVASSLPSVLDLAEPSRNRTLLLLQMCLTTYPSCVDRKEHGGGYECSYSNEVMEPIWNDGASIYGPNSTDRMTEDWADQYLHEGIAASLAKDDGLTDVSAPVGTAAYDVGVSALEFNRYETGETVLAFRGTFNNGDYANIENWMTDFLLEKSTSRMKAAWTDDAGLEWTDEMERRADRSDAAERLAIRAGMKYILSREGRGSFPGDLAEAVAADSNLTEALGGMTASEAQKTGYWKITKQIVDSVLENLPPNAPLVLTGHSQGGTRAQLAAMYLSRTKGIDPPTVTFGATGAACVARHLFSSADILDDIDPFISYPNMVDYVHPLDPWGNAMLGVDSGGNTCFFGTERAHRAQQNGDASSDPAYDYCSRVYGWSGPTVIAARTGHSGPRGPVDPQKLDLDFARCRYFTHMGASMLLALREQGVLSEDGVPDGGCQGVLVVPEDDPQKLCPMGIMSSDEKRFFALVIVLALVGTSLVLIFACRFCQVCFRRVRGLKQNETYSFQLLDQDQQGTPFMSGESGTGCDSHNNEISSEGESDEEIELPRLA